jgi:protein ImuB
MAGKTEKASTARTAGKSNKAEKTDKPRTSSKAGAARTRARSSTGTTNTGTTNTSTPKRTPAREREAPAWPGHLPRPSPATVYSEPVPAQLLDADGRPVAVTGRQMVTAPPVRLSINGGRWMDLEGWAGPWPVDERWWDPPARRRRARFQAVNALGVAYLLSVEKGMWWIEAVYD